MPYLCLDPSEERSGAVIVSDNLKIVDYTIIETEGNDYNRLSHFDDAITTLIEENGVTQIISEDPGFFAPGRSNWANRVLVYLTVKLHCIAQKYNMPEPVFIHPMTLKKWFTENGKATKQEMGNEVIERAGINTGGDVDLDDALAISILLMENGLNGVTEHLQEVKKSNRKRRKKRGSKKT